MKEKYWDKRIETMPRKDLLNLQWKKLSAQVRHAYRNTRLYHEKFNGAGIKPDDIRSIEDFQKKAPLVVKEELRTRIKAGDPFGGALAVPRDKLAWVHSSSGTTGMPTIFGLTAEGMNTFKNMWFRWFVTATCKPGYSFQICGARWHAGWPGLDMAAAEYGMTTICTDLLVALHPFMLQRNLYYAQQLKPDVIFAFPSTITRMEELAKSQGIDPKEIIKYKIMLLGGELLTDTMRKRVEKEYGSEVFQFGGVGGDVYNNVVECTEHDGPHWQEDLWLIENLDPEKLEPLGTGERGNLVLTNLWNQAIPHLRFRTEDAFTFETERCGCGRTHMRGWQLGRVIDIVTVQQKPILPADVENILRETPETETAEYMVVRYATGSLDKLKVKTTYDTKKTKDPAELKVRLEKIISDRLGVPCELEFVSEEEIKASQAKLKAVRVLDLTK